MNDSVSPLWKGVSPYMETGGNPSVTTHQLAQSLYTKYGIAFQMAGLLLLSAIVASVGLVFFGSRQGVKTQNARDQINRDSKSIVTFHRSVPKNRGRK